LLRSLTIVLLVLLFFSCDKTDKIIGTWEIVELSQYPLTITNYGDAKFDKGSRLTFDKKRQLHIFLTDTTKTPETFNYKIQEDEVIMSYSDYAIPLTIKELDENELELETGGFGNTEEIRKVTKRFKFIKVK
jgi:hypothetical protein